MSEQHRDIPLGVALIPVLFLVVALSATIGVFDQAAHIPLMCAAAVAAGVAAFYGYKWKEILDAMVHGIGLAMGAILILMVIGTMIGTWILGGVVPSMIYYGLHVLSPGIFLAAAMLICSIVALGTGSSWSTAGTVGVALMGVGSALSIPPGMTAGAIVSGAYFGDKMSPLSDTTNLAPAMAGTDVFSHVRHMVYTAVPAFVIGLVLYGLLGLRFAGGAFDSQQISQMLSGMQASFTIHPALLLPPCLVIVMVVKKIPPLPALAGGAAIGGACAMIAQSSSLADVIDAANNGFVSATGIPAVDELLSGGGLQSMMNTVALITCALSFGGIMERTRMLEVIALALLRMVHSTGSLVTVTVLSCFGMNVVASDQYMSIVIPGRMFKSAYDKRKLAPKNLSRALEASGTMTSALVPWNTCGAFMSTTLGVSALTYAPFAFLNLLIPLITVFYGYAGITMTKLDESEDPDAVKA
ncbi:MAG TPA: Na+/H+ antiporter NhaC [Myxococcota bacterium]